MPIAQEDDDEDFAPSTLVERVAQTQPRVVAEYNVSPIVDTRYEPLSSLLQYAEGSKLTVDYFSQLVTNTSEASSQQVNLHAVYQQYINIKSLELLVTEPLGYVQDSVTNESILRGTSTLYPTVVANEGDMFVADVGDGKMGVFTITEAIKKTQLIEACYEITYSFTGYADDHRQLLNDLLTKTVKTEVFVKTLLGTATKPFLAEEEFITLSTLKHYLNELVGMYFGLFFSAEHRTFVMPESPVPIYDPYLVKALVSVLDFQEHPIMSRVKVFNIDSSDMLQHDSFWSMFLNNQIDLKAIIPQHMWLVTATSFNMWPLAGSIFHSRMDSVVYPQNKMPGSYSDFDGGGTPLYSVTDLGIGNFPPINVGDAPVANPDGTLITPPFINSVVNHTYYVLSQAFYQQQPVGQSIIELLVSNFLNNRAFNPQHLINLFKDIPNWRDLDKFYHIPVLIILMKIACRRF